MTTEPTNQEVLSDLARVRAAFQLRTITTIMGVPAVDLVDQVRITVLDEGEEPFTPRK